MIERKQLSLLIFFLLVPFALVTKDMTSDILSFSIYAWGWINVIKSLILSHFLRELPQHILFNVIYCRPARSVEKLVNVTATDKHSSQKCTNLNGKDPYKASSIRAQSK